MYIFSMISIWVDLHHRRYVYIMVFSRGVRGAITLNSNTKEEIQNATVELLNEMLNNKGNCTVKMVNSKIDVIK